MIAVLGAVVKTLIIMATGNLMATPSLVLLIKDHDPQSTTYAFLMLFDVMTLWMLVVRSIGLARLSGGSLAKSAAWVFGIWASYSAVMFGFAVAAKAAFAK